MAERFKKDIKRIVIIGPESTGKTELSQFLSAHYNTVFVPEYAREYIENLPQHYTYFDIEHIARKQIELEATYLSKANHLLFYDTYLIITKVWFKVVYNKVPEWLEEVIKDLKIDLFLLCNTQLPWIPDKVRENGGEMREKLFYMYKSELEKNAFNYEVITGIGNDRFNNALFIVENFLMKQEENLI
ncbi:MAG: hypothetical protein A2041_08775 [Bacteroidetes bacterium GWA2_31_9b]|nr:MAG: hypothetical protein A2041_08775 [Bacteroidetes bacterium GWA2_31_9b]